MSSSQASPIRSAGVRTFLSNLGALSVLAIACVWPAPAARAATNRSPIALTGFNRDVVIENTALGPPYSSYALEFNPGEGTCYYQTNLPGESYGLPLSGSFTSASGDGTVFQLQPYTASNALVLSSETAATTATLFLTRPKIFNSIAILANSANGDATGTASVTLHFNDGTTYTTNYYAPDWFNNNNGALYSVALQGFERIDITTGGTSGATTNPRFYETAISLLNVPGGTNKLLSSLTLGKATGSVGGLAHATGVYAVSGLTNASQTNVTFSLATLTNLAATSLSTTGATFNGKVLATGNDAPLVTVYYGPIDGGTNAAAWSNSIVLGWQTGSFSQAVSGLAVSTSYYFTASGFNAGGTAWAKPSRSFTTLAPTPPVVTNLPASSILANSAALNGQVVATGGDTPHVTVYYGPSNGGTNAAAWSNNIAIGLQSGSFGPVAFELASNKTYFYAAKAVNGGGASWAAPSRSFTTLASNPPAIPAAVLTQHNDLGRTGANLNESTLTVNNVNQNQFGLLYARPLDDQVYAQPLVMTNVNIPGKGVHNVLYVCTVNDTVYAFDADNALVTAPYWTNSFIGNFAGYTAVAPRNTDMDVDYVTGAPGACGGNYMDFSGAFGIVGAPVIDPIAGTLFVLARTKETTSNSNITSFVQRLHALDITTGAERSNSPVVIAATYPGTNSVDSTNGVVTFDPYKQNQRAGLALANGIVYIAWTSHCDWTPYHGWVMAYDETNLQQLAVYNDTPNGDQAGLWMSNQGLPVDSSGNVYISTANGDVDAVDRGESFVKLNGANLTEMSFFTPYNYNTLNGGDLDLGSGGLLLVPGTSLLFGGGKGGVAYLVNKDNMGGLSSGNADTNIVQSFPVTTDELHGGATWWNGPGGPFCYLWPASVHLQQYVFNQGAGMFQLPVLSQSPTAAPTGQPGGLLALSANGTNAGTAIVWAAHQVGGDANQQVLPGILHAYDAQNVTNELWNSSQISARDAVGNFAKFVAPTVANGKVYLATFSSNLNVYGLLLNSAPQILQQPQSATLYAGSTFTVSVAASGTAPLSYLWHFNSSAIAGATNSSYTVANIQPANAGNYSCSISNSLGSTNTALASLDLVAKPYTTYPLTVLGDNPMGYWRLDETNGTVAYDYVGGFNGQYSNVSLGLPGYNQYDPDTAAGFGSLSASDSYVGGVAIDFSSQANPAFSVECWVNAGPQIGGAGIITKGTGGGGEQFNLDTGAASQSFRFFVRDSSGTVHLANGNIAPSGQWQHVVGVCDEPNGAVNLYVDGAPNAAGTITAGTGARSSANAVTFGARQSGGGTPYDLQFVGTIDEVAIYNYALSAAQIQNHYTVGTNLQPVMLFYQLTGNTLQLTWASGTLQSAGVVTGPYTAVTGATSPFAFTISRTNTFFRVQVR